MSDLVARLSNSTFFRQTVIVYAGTAVVHVSNLLFQLFMVRQLTPDNYAALAAIIALIYVIIFPNSAISLVASKFAAEFAATKRPAQIGVMQREGNRVLWWLSIGLMGLYLLTSPLTARFLGIPLLNVALLAPLLLFVYLLPLERGILQGLNRFLYLSVSLISESVGKLALGVGLVILGLSLQGAVISFAGSVIIAFVFTRYFSSKTIEPPPPGLAAKRIDYLKVVQQSMPIVATSLVFNLLFYMDQLLVKHLVPTETASLYAALTLVGRMALFLASPVALVMFPKIIEHKESFPLRRKFLNATVALSVLLSAGVFVVFQFAPHLVLKLLFFSSANEAFYRAVAPYLGVASVVFALASLSSTIAYYQMAKNDFRYLFLVVLALLLEFELIYLYHGSIGAIITVLIVVNAALFIGLFMTFILRENKESSV